MELEGGVTVQDWNAYLPRGGLVSDFCFCFASIFLARAAPRSWKERLVLSFDDVALPALFLEKLSLPW